MQCLRFGLLATHLIGLGLQLLLDDLLVNIVCIGIPRIIVLILIVGAGQGKGTGRVEALTANE